MLLKTATLSHVGTFLLVYIVFDLQIQLKAEGHNEGHTADKTADRHNQNTRDLE